ncbi:MAG: GNAT family N-acetyltransferase [Xanthomonadales bacterium]|nr:GNAT family N-acetyltransferase [Xanthomonadales bacterium]
MSVQVRRASADDLDRLVPLFDGYRRFYEQERDPDAARDFLKARLDSGDSVILLAEHDGEAIGFTQLYPLFSSVRMARIWILNDLFVDESHRQRGAGRALLEAAQAYAEDDGAAALQLETQRTNSVAQSLYTRLGWEAPDDTIWFNLPLDDSVRGRQRADAPFGIGN